MYRKSESSTDSSDDDSATRPLACVLAVEHEHEVVPHGFLEVGRVRHAVEAKEQAFEHDAPEGCGAVGTHARERVHVACAVLPGDGLCTYGGGLGRAEDVVPRRHARVARGPGRPGVWDRSLFFFIWVRLQ